MTIRDLYPLSPPENWQTFEDLCLHLCRARWRDPSAQKNGRQGQAQAGVDVFGEDRRRQAWGVQCKGKTDYPGGFLRPVVIEEEARRALAFQPPLQRFAIAAAVVRDARAQEAARQITRRNRASGLFDVEVWSWEDIRDELYGYPEVIRRIYPQFFSNDGLDRLVRQGPGSWRVDLYGKDTLERMAAVVEQLGSETPLPRPIWRIVASHLVELAAKAVDHGEAGRVFIGSDGSGLLIEDDGAAFNPLNPPDSLVINAGLRYLAHVRRVLEDQVAFAHERTEGWNKFHVHFKQDAYRPPKSRRYVIDGASLPFQRTQVDRAIDIPEHVDEVVVNLTTMKFVAPSTGHAVFDAVNRQLKPHQTARIIVPAHLANFADAEALAPRLQIEIGADETD